MSHSTIESHLRANDFEICAAELICSYVSRLEISFNNIKFDKLQSLHFLYIQCSHSCARRSHSSRKLPSIISVRCFQRGRVLLLWECNESSYVWLWEEMRWEWPETPAKDLIATEEGSWKKFWLATHRRIQLNRNLIITRKMSSRDVSFTNMEIACSRISRDWMVDSSLREK